MAGTRDGQTPSDSASSRSRGSAASASRAGRAGATPARRQSREDDDDAVMAEQLAALHKRHIYDTSVLLQVRKNMTESRDEKQRESVLTCTQLRTCSTMQKEREILAMANRKGSSMSVSYLASLGRLLQQKAGMVTRLLSLLPASAAESLGIANESPRL